MPVSELQIVEAAESFVAKHGKTPTYEELRATLGGGSPSTLNKYYRSWRQKKDAELVLQAANAPVFEKVPLPDTLVDALTTAWSGTVGGLRSGHDRDIHISDADVTDHDWNTSVPKIIDNAIIGFLKHQGI